MKICMLISMKIPPEDGGGNFVINLSKELIKKGHSVTIITRGGLSPTKHVTANGIDIYYVPFIPLYPFHVHIHGFFVNNLFKKMESQFDILHYHSPLPPIVKTKIPTITTLHLTVASEKKIKVVDMNSLGHKLYSYITDRIERKRLNNTKLITVVSSSLQKEVQELYNIELDHVNVIGNAVDPTIFYPIKKNTNRYILYTGRWSVEKGISDFIECCFKICDKYPNINIKMTGRGPLLNKLSKRIEDSNHNERFEILGYVNKEQLIELYQNATVFVLPSYSEGLPTTMLEAMSCGIPVVATSIDGVIDVIDNNKNGILIPIKSPDSMYTAICNILNDDDFREQLGDNARATIKTKFNWDRLSNTFIEYYSSILR